MNPKNLRSSRRLDHLRLVSGWLISPRGDIGCTGRLALDREQIEAAVLHDDIDLGVVILSNISKQYGRKSRSRMVRQITCVYNW
jgi:hypothetical protein